MQLPKALKFIPIVFLFSACSDKKDKHPVIRDTAQLALYKIIRQANTDTNLFTKPVAIEVWPSKRLIEKYKRATKDLDGFYTASDDNGYYMAQSRSYLDSINARHISRFSEGVLIFKSTSGKIFKMKIDTIYFGFILFNGKTKPVLADIVDLQSDYEKYMKN